MEVDRDAGRLHAVHEDDDGTDLMLEVKDWEREPSFDAVRRFIEVKDALATPALRRKAGHRFRGPPHL